MSRRYVDPDIWVKLHGTKPAVKLVAVQLQLNSPNPGGIYLTSIPQIAMQTGLRDQEIKDSLVVLNERKIAFFDPETKIVYLPGFAAVQGLNPSVSRAINRELERLGPSPLVSEAMKIPQLKAQDPKGYDRVVTACGQGGGTLSICLSSLKRGESEGGAGTPRKPWFDGVLDAVRKEWPRGEDGKLYRFDRGKAAAELKKLKNGDRPTIEEVVAGVKVWGVVWAQGFQHKASTFIRDRLWEQSPSGMKPQQKSITTKPLFVLKNPREEEQDE